ncbi:MAG: hypothetical protein GWN84_18650 [Gammaproteobacteria bacterium]|nr:hypothetical protein [Gammaproteobacteria bacterium]NIR84847.1 hypothetical protein [Gammaproteobacteria bacterium]NIR91619.1 hypothetical protein [Gammaproteobacteria bacterium]NIU05898.1 hypothetical protein [Gammaproteobacteria bacterium]NIV76812.1 hypothetical protein [Gammaproteobacteria bacterium]
MKRPVLAVLVPPFAVCRYGCAGCCAAPIGVFWLAGIVSLVYAALGGPLGLAGVSWGTVGLGAALWAVAAGWAVITLRNVDDERCGHRTSPVCARMAPRADEPAPLDEIRRAG